MNTENESMKQYNLTRDGERDLRFTGRILADVSSHSYRGDSQNRWTELALYQTKAGKYVVQSVGRTIWEGENNRYSATVCDDTEKVIETLTIEGYLSALAKELLDEAKIDYSEEVE